MIYNIRGDKILVTNAIKEYITEKLDRLNKYFDKPEEITANILKLQFQLQILQLEMKSLQKIYMQQ